MYKQLRPEKFVICEKTIHIAGGIVWNKSVRCRPTQPLCGLANELYDGNVEAFANGINECFQQVAVDLHPLLDSFTPPPADHFPSEFFIDQTTVELKLSRVKK